MKDYFGADLFAASRIETFVTSDKDKLLNWLNRQPDFGDTLMGCRVVLADWMPKNRIAFVSGKQVQFLDTGELE